MLKALICSIPSGGVGDTAETPENIIGRGVGVELGASPGKT